MDKVTDSPSSWEDLYSINLTPKEIFVKLRKQVEGHQLGLNFEENSYNTKLVFKPLTPERKWKFIYEPKIGDVGMGYSFHDHSAGWKWKLTTSLGGDGISQIRHKALLPIFPGFDVRIGWNAEYILPDIHGAVGTGEPIIGMNLGRLYTSIDRVEAILTHAT
ncbi:uncharacterized protein LOC131066782 isoform X4 [Cryptomeria japonica]|uniref:uncharacterized protein LOC131066782 isoform X4 n=1 Tax=Cryptomeria japonica TaxID=3369 RepID=UPI0027D9DA21|nr:uncharacterized protein LOC131066782 isoform X4 [Cryptomeria japonica]